MEILQGLLDNLTALLAAHPLAGEWYMAFVRFLFPALAVLILYRAVRSLLRIPHTPENWGQLSLPNGTSLPLTHWENILGRSKTADIYLNYPSISRQHAALCRGEDENWTLYDLGSKGGTAVNGEKVASSVPVKLGDTITLGGVPLIFLPQTVAEREEQEAKRRAERPAAIWPSFLWLTVFQVLACLQLLVAAGTEATIAIPLAFLGLTVLMWLYYAALRATRCVGFEMETIAFFLSTLSLSITASSAQSSLFKQFLAILLGLALFLVLGLFLRDLSRVQKNRWLMAAAAIGLLGITLVIGNSKYGAVNWISIGGMSFQPSEIAKICYIFAGAATLERLFHKRNLTLFIVLTGVCIGLLGLMSDFGTAAIFFVTFLVIAYMRSGDFATLSLICGGAVFGAGIILKFKPYILSRFASWGHAWEAASTTGYQQTRTMSAAASGGLFGNGADNGWLKYVGASNTDLVFGMVAEELGLIVAVLTVVCIVTFSLFTIKAAATSRSTFYTIAACSTSTMLVFQTVLNVLGSVDLLPLTGVTFPFLSCGGSSMIACWALLAFIKAGDNRQNSGLAVRLPGRRDEPIRSGGGGDPMLEFDPSVFDSPSVPPRRSAPAIDIPLSKPRRHSHVDDVMADLGSIDFAHLDTIGEDCGIDVPLPGEERGRKRRSSIDIPVDDRKGAKR